MPGGAVRARSEILSFPAPELTVEQKRRAREMFEQQRALKLPLLEIASAYRILSLAAMEGKPLTAEVQVITVGRELAWVGLPGEVFTELGMAIKNGSPFPYTIVSSLANDYLSYFINRKAYAEGNYEAVVTRFAPGAGEALVDAAVRMLTESWQSSGK